MILDDIIAAADLRAADAASSRIDLERRAGSAPVPRSLAAALSGPGLSVIAEIKRRSPSAGAIDPALDPAALARLYARGGASAVSVLTEPDFFGGSLADLEAVRDAVEVPVLRKDFTRNAAQIWEARASGADAVLLIVATLSDAALENLIGEARDVGVDAIVEAHTIPEVLRASGAGASIIGVNNRDLTTFTTDLSVAEQSSGVIPSDVVRIAESGVSSREGAARMRAAGYDAILVGEALVRHRDPLRFVAELAGVP
jgi:indole-3-glycerol phosphate synthase